jgi:uncharacterized protein (TIGR03437 family)
MRQIVFLVPLVVQAQVIAIRLDPINLISPAINADGRTIVYAAATSPDSTPQQSTNLYLYNQGELVTRTQKLTNYSGSALFNGITGVTLSNSTNQIAFTAIPNGPGGPEEIHVIDMQGLNDRTLVTDKQGCVQPLCPNCFRACVGPVHVNPSGSKILYAVARQQPFFVMNADGTGSTQLPVFQGALAPSPQRVISRDGTIVFTSSAPSGPTFAASAIDVYTINLDGTGLKQITKFGNNPDIFAASAVISADGSTIAFESSFSNAGPQTRQVFAIHSDGTGFRQLSFGPDAASSPSITADGHIVTFLQSGQIKIAGTLNDPAEFKLTKLSLSAPLDPVISDDGTQVAFTIGPMFRIPGAVFRIPAGLATDFRNFVPIYTPRFLSVNGVGTAAGHGVPSPGSLISVYGFNLAQNELTLANASPLPTTLDSVSLLVNGQPVPLLATTPWQINAQLPQSASTGQATFQLRVASGAAVPPITANVTGTSPENFVFAFSRGNLGYQQAAAFHAGTALAADLDHPAAAGEVLEFYGLGLGLTDPPVDPGVPSPASPPARARQTPHLEIGGRDATILFAGLTPGIVGVYQVNAIVPAGLAPGIQNVNWAGSGTIYSAIAVK